MEDYNQRIKDIQLLDELSSEEKIELLEDLKYEIELDEAVDEMQLKANLLKTIDLLAKVI